MEATKAVDAMLRIAGFQLCLRLARGIAAVPRNRQSSRRVMAEAEAVLLEVQVEELEVSLLRRSLAQTLVEVSLSHRWIQIKLGDQNLAR